MAAFTLVVVTALCIFSVATGHGAMTDPRCRGALKTKRNVHPQVLNPHAPLDYCFSCQNAGGVNVVRYHSRGNPWRPYDPMKGGRAGFGMCGDPAGSHDHMKGGRYGNPKGMPFVRKYKPGSVANFEFDATANHGGYLEFYLCDVSQMPYQDLSFSGFAQRCHYLKRVPNGSCESGNDRECGPIDQKFPGRWVLPCGRAGGDTGDQILGGKNGKMAYQLPNVHIEVGVIQMYWLTTNACNTPDGFMQNYKYPKAWGNCHGDGGSIGGKPQHHLKCGEHNQFPEEFWNCADVQVKNGGADIVYADNPGYSQSYGYSGARSPAVVQTGHRNGYGSPNMGGRASVGHGSCTSHGMWCNGKKRCCSSSDVCLSTKHGSKCLRASYHKDNNSYNNKNDGNCYRRGMWCNSSKRCCRESDVCMATKHGNKCSSHSKMHKKHNNGNKIHGKKHFVQDGNCTRRGNWCNGSKRCCHESDSCQQTKHGKKCVAPGSHHGGGNRGNHHDHHHRHNHHNHRGSHGFWRAFRP